MMRRPTDQHGFTLIEALVSLAIIGVLATLLAGALGSAKAAARRIVCTGSLRQLAFASQMYWNDHDQFSFPYLTRGDSGMATYWFGALSPGAEGARRLDRDASPLAPYLSFVDLGVCPSFPIYNPNYKAKSISTSFGYGYNLHLAPSRTRPSLSQGAAITDIPNPSRIALFADAAQINDFQSPASPANPLLEEFYYINADPWDYPNGHFRHQDSAQVASIDGHVAAERLPSHTLDTRVPDWNIARFPSELLVPSSQNSWSLSRLGNE